LSIATGKAVHFSGMTNIGHSCQQAGKYLPIHMGRQYLSKPSGPNLSKLVLISKASFLLYFPLRGEAAVARMVAFASPSSSRTTAWTQEGKSGCPYGNLTLQWKVPHL
jgi:hypothetical protein